MKELELLAGLGAQPARLLATLSARAGVQEGEKRELALSFYDTFDGRLHRAGLVLCHARDLGAQDSPGQLVLYPRPGWGEALAVAPGPPLSCPALARALPRGPLAERLAGVLEQRALLVLAGVRAHAVELAARDWLAKTIARGELVAASLQEGEGEGAGGQALRVRVRLRALRGYEQELGALRRRLEALSLAAAGEPLVDEAARAAGRPPEGVSAAVSVALVASQRSDAAAVAVLRRLAEVIEANRQGAIAAIDPEFLHDLRVALRRTRTVLKQLRGVFDPQARAHFAEEFRWLARQTGPARDLEVQIADWESLAALVGERWRADLAPVVAVLERRRELALRACARALDGERARALALRWGELLDGLVASDEAQRPDAARAIGELAGRRIRRVYERMRSEGAQITPSSGAGDYHQLRKRGKELRYLLELFGRPLYGAGAVRDPVAALKDLQDVLGRHQDREAQIALLESLAGELARAPGGARALMACGVLIERLHEDELAARRDFATCFEPFADRRMRRIIRERLR